MTVRLTHKGQSVTMETAPATMRVTWCSHWELIDDLVTAGVLRRENLGPSTLGHCNYFYI